MIVYAFTVAFFLSIMIGPVFFVLIDTSISKGIKAALFFNSGVLTGDIFFILVAYLSSYQLIQKIKGDPLLFITGGLIMTVYGIFSLWQLRNSKSNQNESKVVVKLNKKNYLGLFVKGFLLNFINIGVLGFWLGVIITVTPRLEMDTSRIVLFFAAVILFYFLIDLVKISLANQLKKKLTVELIYSIKKYTSVSLIVFGVVLTFQGIFPGGKDQIVNYLLELNK